MTLAAEPLRAAADQSPLGFALRWAIVFGVATALGLAAVAAAPLAAYVALIAAFGLPHVLAELRYCDRRFGARTPRAAIVLIGVPLATLLSLRFAGGAGLLPGWFWGPAELICGAGLAISAAMFMRRWRVLGLLIGLTIATGAVLAPLTTFLVWAWLHNITPLAFAAERVGAAARGRVLAGLSVFFLIIPACVAAGALVALTGRPSAQSLFGAGQSPLLSFLPPGMALTESLALFQAAVLAQVMHYVAVIGFLPALDRHLGASQEAILPWPRGWAFVMVLAAAGLGSLAFYAVDYREAKTAYALTAALHSWIELPLFLMALGGGFTRGRGG